MLVKEKERLTEELDTHIDNPPTLKKKKHLLESIPGVGSVVSKVGPPNVRAKIYMAVVVVKQHNPDVKEHLKSRGQTHMQALGAAMRKLVQICFGVVKHQSEYKPQIV
ncbi:hypothetical protein C0J08_08515 [Marinomonas sp. CT5]|nr:hypothetical protein C0J08_08515 [Marinomonas sp. CT5]